MAFLGKIMKCKVCGSDVFEFPSIIEINGILYEDVMSYYCSNCDTQLDDNKKTLPQPRQKRVTKNEIYH